MTDENNKAQIPPFLAIPTKDFKKIKARMRRKRSLYSVSDLKKLKLLLKTRRPKWKTEIKK